MKLRAQLLLSVVLLAAPAFAAGALDAQRASVRAARDEVSALKASQLAARNELSQLSSRIGTLKASHKGKLLPGGELDSALKRSQELSNTLTGLAQQLSSRDAELESAELALLDGLSNELKTLRADFDRQPDREARRATLEKMKSVRREREVVRAALPATKLPALDALKPSDDPEELLEQADLLRDREEKVQKELKALEQRISEKKEEAELDRRVQRFMGEESLFDDQDRRLRLQRSTTLSGDTKTVGTPASESSGSTTTFGAGSQTDTAAGTNGPSTGAATPGAFGGAGAPASPASPTAPSATGRGTDGNVKFSTASDARPQVGGGRGIATGDEDESNDLEIQRAKLKGLADELKKKAQELELKAGQLK